MMAIKLGVVVVTKLYQSVDIDLIRYISAPLCTVYMCLLFFFFF